MMRPTDPSISPAALSRILDGLEVSLPTTRKTLSEVTGLGRSTVNRAVSACLNHGILVSEAGHLLVSDNKFLLPVVTVTGEHGVIRVLNMDLTPIATSTVELYPASPPEESARLLARRLLTLLRGCGKGAVTAPVLVSDGALPTHILENELAHALGQAPLTVVDEDQAVARGIKGSPLSTEAESLLFASVGGGAHACLLLKDEEGIWHPSKLGDNLTHTLLHTLHATESPEGVRRGMMAFLADLCRFLCPDLILVEDGRSILPDSEFYKPLLPDGVDVLVIHGDESLTVSELGGALTGRRMLWDKILLG